MAVIAYFLCTLTSALCAYLLIVAYWKNRVPVLFWSGLCFVGLTITNFIVVLDRLVFPELDLIPLRLCMQLVALTLLMVGLIWREE